MITYNVVSLLCFLCLASTHIFCVERIVLGAPKTLHQAAGEGDLGAMEQALNRGEQVNSQEALYGHTALHCAIMRRQLAAVRWLLMRGSQLSFRDRYGINPVLVAICSGNLPMVTLLRDYGADFKRCCSNQSTALHWVASTGQQQLVPLLLDAGLAVNAQDLYGSTPLHMAVRWGRIAAVRALLQRGARLDIRDIFSKTALEYALDKVSEAPLVTMYPDRIEWMELFEKDEAAKRSHFCELAAVLLKRGAQLPNQGALNALTDAEKAFIERKMVEND